VRCAVSRITTMEMNRARARNGYGLGAYLNLDFRSADSPARGTARFPMFESETLLYELVLSRRCPHRQRTGMPGTTMCS
jgi:hypothetical protein